MSVSSAHQNGLTLPSALGLPGSVFGMVGVFAIYWDEAWHTDVGRDSAWSAPHVLLYSSVGLVGVCVAVWGIRCLVAARSVRALVGHPPLLAAGMGGVGVMAAAPIDAAWHAAYGRDAVLWSPPHLLVVCGSTALMLGVLSGLPRDARATRLGAGILVLASVEAVVFEFEADVPQFTEVLYLPVLLAIGLPVAALLSRTLSTRAPVTLAVAGYVVLRLSVAAGLAAMGRSTPDLPVVVVGLAAWDLPLGHWWRRAAAAGAATAALALGAASLQVASPPPGAVAVLAVPVISAGLVVLLLSGGRRLRHLGTVGLVLLVAIATLGRAEPARAHDPGQGEDVLPVELTARVDGEGGLSIVAALEAPCEQVAPRDVVARRAGGEVRGDLVGTGSCRFAGTVEVPDRGRWFVYVEFSFAGDRVEAWLPIEAGEAGTTSGRRELYVPAGEAGGVDGGQWAAGGVLYALSLVLLFVGARAATRQPARRGESVA